MTIHTRLRITAWAPLLMAVVVGVTLTFSHVAIRTGEQQRRAVERVLRSMNDLHSLVGAYSLHQEDRARQQFLAEHDALRELLASVQFPNPAQRGLLETIRQNTDSMKDTFVRIVATHHTPPGNPSRWQRQFGSPDRLGRRG